MSAYHILIAGLTATGKTTSLRNLALNHPNPKSVAYICCEAGKTPIWAKRFTTTTDAITHPDQVVEFFAAVEEMPNIEYCVLDGFNFLMKMFVSEVIDNMSNTQVGWGDYAKFIQRFMQQTVGNSTKKWIILAHNEEETVMTGPNTGMKQYRVPLQGSEAKHGYEAWFNHVIYTTKIPTALAQKLLDEGEFVNPEQFTISPQERKAKYAFVTQQTDDFALGRIRSDFGTWDLNQTYIDNDIQLVMNHFDKLIDVQN